jgi:RecA-family ATPase
MIAGETEVGKSLLALEIAAGLLTGGALWGSLPVAERLTRVLYILGEHDVDTLRGLWATTELVVPPNALAVIGPDSSPAHHLVTDGAPNPEAIQQVRAWVQGAGLVVFDPLAAFIRGVGAENDNIQMRLLVDTLTHAAQDEGAACLILSHLGKPLMVAGKPVPRGRYATRGASATEDAATSLFYMEHVEHPAAREAAVFRLRKRKYKGVAPEFYYLVRDPSTLRHTLLTGPRPHVEARRGMFRERLKRLQAHRPTSTPTECIELLAAIEGISRRTAFRYIDSDDD